MEVKVSSQETFEPFRTEIRKGSTLVEASAGTGKTYTLVTIVLRPQNPKTPDILKIINYIIIWKALELKY